MPRSKSPISIIAQVAGSGTLAATRSDDDMVGRIEEFQQADSSVTKQKGGTGLGLAIAKRIIEMHGGRLWGESELGCGSTFAFAVPVNVETQVGH